jgi:broad specificity phosphatase PhoE
MTLRRIHLVRHGEVENPDGVLYGRLPGFHLTERGRRSAQSAADAVVEFGRPVAAVWSSPLERAVESAAPIARSFGLDVRTQDGLIEASSKLEGGEFRMDFSIFGKPAAWRYLVNPFRPSWGEPFTEVAARMLEVIRRAAAVEAPGDVVLVSHQLPIWMAHRRAVGRPLFHNPGARRCSLSSITSFTVGEGGLEEVAYIAPGADADADAVDVGAV